MDPILAILAYIDEFEKKDEELVQLADACRAFKEHGIPFDCAAVSAKYRALLQGCFRCIDNIDKQVKHFKEIKRSQGQSILDTEERKSAHKKMIAAAKSGASIKEALKEWKEAVRIAGNYDSPSKTNKETEGKDA